MQRAQVRPDNRNVGRHGIPGSESRRVCRDNQEKGIRSDDGVRAETKIDSCERPCVGRNAGIEKRPWIHRVSILQFNELIATRRGIVMNLVNHDGLDERSRVGAAEGSRLGRKLFFARAVDVAAKRNVVGGAIKRHAVGIAGQVCVRVAGQQIELFARGTQRETIVRSWGGIELRFIERKKVTSQNRGAGSDAIFFGNRGIIAQKPAAHIHVRSRGIE